MENKNLVLFCHGIGTFTKGRLPTDAQALTDNIPNSKVEDFCWSELVDRSFEWDAVDTSYLSRLGKALNNAAWLGFSPKLNDSTSKKVFLSLSNFFGYLLYVSVLISPIILYFYCGSLLFTDFFENVDPIWGLSTEKMPLRAMFSSTFFGNHTLFNLYDTAFHYLMIIGTSTILLSLLFSCFAFGIIKGVVNGVRRVLIIVLWPLVFLFVALSTYTKRSLLAIGIMFIFPMLSQLSLLYVHLYDDFSNAYGVLIAILILAVFVLILKLVTNLFGIQLKLLGDIFFYIGDTQYRKKINKAFEQQVKRLSETRNRVTFISHSLGSVIVTDHLLNSDYLKNQEIFLITMGSPLKRCFYSMFSVFFLPPTEIALQLKSRYQKFKWLNIYRPLDFIGARLSGSTFQHITNVSSKQYRDPFSSHIGYWRDQKIGTIIKSNLPTVFEPLNQPHPTKETKYDRQNLFESGTHRLRVFGAYLLIFIFPIWLNIIDARIIEPRFKKQQIQLRYSDLHQNGFETVATVYPLKTTDKVREDGVTNYYPNYKIALQFKKENGEEATINFISKITVDMRKFSDEFEYDKTLEDNAYREVIKYKSFQTPLIYHPANSDKFMLPEFTTDKPVSDGLYPIMEFLSPLTTPIITLLLVLLLFGPLITTFTFTENISIVEFIQDKWEDFMLSF